MTRKTLIEEIEGGVAILVLSRPKQRNAFNKQMYGELAQALRAAQERDEVRVVIVTGSPGAFSAGQDLAEMSDPAIREGGAHGFGPFMDALCTFDKPLIAAVNGVGVGLGLTMLLHCDIVYIARGARLRPPFVSLGVVPEAASSYLLPATIGFQRAAEVFYTADWIDAERALELGIASRVCEPEELLPAARETAQRIAAQPPMAVQHTKRLLLSVRADAVRAARKREDRVFEERLGSPENREAIAAFFEKREADFSRLNETPERH